MTCDWAEYDKLTTKLQRGITKKSGGEAAENARGQVYAGLVASGCARKLRAKYTGKRYKHGRKGA